MLITKEEARSRFQECHAKGDWSAWTGHINTLSRSDLRVFKSSMQVLLGQKGSSRPSAENVAILSLLFPGRDVITKIQKKTMRLFLCVMWKEIHQQIPFEVQKRSFLEKLTDIFSSLECIGMPLEEKLYLSTDLLDPKLFRQCIREGVQLNKIWSSHSPLMITLESLKYRFKEGEMDTHGENFLRAVLCLGANPNVPFTDQAFSGNHIVHVENFTLRKAYQLRLLPAFKILLQGGAQASFELKGMPPLRSQIEEEMLNPNKRNHPFPMGVTGQNFLDILNEFEVN
jgi:hypothetical protein